MRERANTIEDLTEQREYIKTIPESVTSQQSRIDQAMANYDMIEEYFYPLSDDDFNSRYKLELYIMTYIIILCRHTIIISWVSRSVYTGS